MRGDDLGDLVVVGQRPLEVVGRGQVARPPLAWRACRRRHGEPGPAGSRTGHARASADRPGREELLAHERREQRLELCLVEAASGAARPRRVNVLPRTAASWISAALLRREAVEPGGDQRVQRLGDLERVDRRRPARYTRPSLRRARRGRAASARSRPRTAGRPRPGRRIWSRSVSGRPGTSPSSSCVHRRRRAAARGRAT